MNWLEKINVKYIMNIPLKEGDSFYKKEIYSYVFPAKPKIKTIIEIEHYENNIIVLSYYRDGCGNDNTRYKIRHDYPAVVVLRIFQACIKIFIQLNSNGDYTLVFNASDDIGKYKEFNDRMSAYTKFLDYYYPNFSKMCYYSGYMTLNTFYFHHKENIYAKSAKYFFDDYCEKVKIQLNSSNESSTK